MSSPQFLLAKESNPALLHILLESITNIIEHQHSQNPILLYAIIRNHSKFEALQNFDLKAAIAALEERRKVTDEKDSPQPEPKPSTEITSPTSPSTPATAFSVGGEEEEEEEEELAEIRPLSEKARGKLPEGVELPRRESALSIRSASGILTPAAGESKDFRPTEAWVYLPLPTITRRDTLTRLVGCDLAPVSSDDVNNASHPPTRTGNFLTPVLPPNTLFPTCPRTPTLRRNKRHGTLSRQNRTLQLDCSGNRMVQILLMGSNFLVGDGFAEWNCGSLEGYRSTLVQSSTK
jgi:High-temperature-induced dauer-formation protein